MKASCSIQMAGYFWILLNGCFCYKQQVKQYKYLHWCQCEAESSPLQKCPMCVSGSMTSPKLETVLVYHRDAGPLQGEKK